MMSAPAPSASRYFGTKRIHISSPAPMMTIAASRMTMLRLRPKKWASDALLFVRDSNLEIERRQRRNRRDHQTFCRKLRAARNGEHGRQSRREPFFEREKKRP